MNISELKKKKVQTEARVAEFLETTLKEFCNETGVSIKSVSIRMLRETRIEEVEDKYIIDDVYFEVAV